MRQYSDLYSNLANCLRSLLGLLELDLNAPLYRDVLAICDYLVNPIYKIAVFAPFNHGKSTLLNALLGNKTLPIDLIPTTGAAISVGYGDSLETKITFQDGKELQASGTQLLKQYGILDDEGGMSSEVASIRLSYAHPWLKTGVEFLDLPGTNDRQAQNDLVQNQLLSADLIIHVLDARKLMTLEERENLSNWLYSRGVNTVVFVVNFLNLLTPEEQKAVQNRLCFVAESFRSELPPGISNLYCVDALPALRARLKGDRAAAQTSGLTSFESALQHLVSFQVNHQASNQIKLSRVRQIAQQLLEQASAKQQEIKQAQAAAETKQERQTAIKQKAAKLIQQSFNQILSDFRGWLYLPKLLTNYQASLAIALQQGRFAQWLLEFQAEILTYQKPLNKCINQGCEFFQHLKPHLLSITLPEPPIIQLPEPIADQVASSSPETAQIPRELNFMLNSKAGAVILGGASYVLHKVSSKSTHNSAPNQSANQSAKISSQVYADAAEDYLQEFGDHTNVYVNQYEKIAQNYLTFTPPATSNAMNTNEKTREAHQLKLLESMINNLTNELNSVSTAHEPSE